jgi:hypothetical protein
MKFDDDFKYLIPKISKEEYALLKRSILMDGCRDSIVVWTETLDSGQPARTIILDGNNRYEICKKSKIDFQVIHLKLKNMEEAKIWVIENQLGRRNLTDYQRGKLTLELKTMIQKKAKDHLKTSTGGKSPQPLQKSANPAPIDTREELAKLAGVSHDPIHKIEVIEKEGPPEIKQAAEKGEISINKAYKETRPKKENIIFSKSPLVLPKGLSLDDKVKLERLQTGWASANDKVKKLFVKFIHRYRESHLFINPRVY